MVTQSCSDVHQAIDLDGAKSNGPAPQVDRFGKSGRFIKYISKESNSLEDGQRIAPDVRHYRRLFCRGLCPFASAVKGFLQAQT